MNQVDRSPSYAGGAEGQPPGDCDRLCDALLEVISTGRMLDDHAVLLDAERILASIERDPRAPADVALHTGRIRESLARCFHAAAPTDREDYQALVTDVARLSFALRDPTRPVV